MKRVLVPVDFTPASRNAAEYAACLAKAFHVPLYLLHIFLEPVSTVEVPSAWVLSGGDLQQENMNRIQNEIAYLKARYDIEINGTAELGFTGDTINSVAKEQDADLIVMGMREGSHSRFFESTIVTAVRKTNIPVLVVPQSASYVPFKHIVVAADFSKLKHTSCWSLFDSLVERFDATVQVLHVQPKERELKESEVSGKLQLQSILANISYSYQLVEDANVEHGILTYTSSHPADLLVMVAHRHNLAERIFGTLHTRSMSYEINLPLLILEDR